mmetsp:Transcript_10033/g.30917  ORF Transcript_10033/g.30917 Transcript_10033/m.30917 type:complete len:262 (-) Transcript_10033:461-1246(-)
MYARQRWQRIGARSVTSGTFSESVSNCSKSGLSTTDHGMPESFRKLSSNGDACTVGRMNLAEADPSSCATKWVMDSGAYPFNVPTTGRGFCGDANGRSRHGVGTCERSILLGVLRGRARFGAGRPPAAAAGAPLIDELLTGGVAPAGDAAAFTVCWAGVDGVVERTCPCGAWPAGVVGDAHCWLACVGVPLGAPACCWPHCCCGGCWPCNCCCGCCCCCGCACHGCCCGGCPAGGGTCPPIGGGGTSCGCCCGTGGACWYP